MEVIDTNGSLALIRDASPDRTDLYLDIYLAVDHADEGMFAEMLAPAWCKRVDLPEDADVIIFGGGVDVNPDLYGAVRHISTHFNDARDKRDIELYMQAIDQGIPMFGVCRGAQFLHVMNGGVLYQDVNNHNGDHVMYLVEESRILDRVSSVHHQMCVKNPEGGMKVLGTSSKASERWLDDVTVDRRTTADVEAFFYEDTCCFGVQGHPEYRGYGEFARWVMKKMDEYFISNKDLTLKGRVRRIRDEILEARNAKWAEMGDQTLVIKETQQ